MPVINVNGVDLNYRESGSRDKRTIVFAPPILFGAEVFDHLASELVNDFHIVTVDLHGHRNSGYRTPLTVEDMKHLFEQIAPARHVYRAPSKMKGKVPLQSEAGITEVSGACGLKAGQAAQVEKILVGQTISPIEHDLGPQVRITNEELILAVALSQCRGHGGQQAYQSAASAR